MKMPKLEIVSSRPAVRTELPTTIDVLLKITPPPPESTGQRPTLNLGLVLDRSGSMNEARKITFAREAAAFAVRELAATDRVSITIFDDVVETIVPNGLVRDKESICRQIEAIQPRNSTALHAGWQEGGRQVLNHKLAEGLNRVILLSDGLANVGESAPDKISDDVHKLAQHGVSTSTLGLGDHYNEDLLEAMARSGDGNYYYVESAAQLPNIFRTELQGMNATTGTAVTLHAEPSPGVTVADLLNDFSQGANGSWNLPNLVGGTPLYLVMRLNVSAFNGERELIRFRVEWQSPKDDKRWNAWIAFTLPAVPSKVWDELAENGEVKEMATLFQAARNKKEAARKMEQGDAVGARQIIACTMGMIQELADSSEVLRERQELADVEQDLENQNAEKFRKRAKNQAYQRSANKPYTPPSSE